VHGIKAITYIRYFRSLLFTSKLHTLLQLLIQSSATWCCSDLTV